MWEWVEWESLWINNASIRCAHYFQESEMSVFGDFQRFPGTDLPSPREEDVRANLARHKQKVAVLREELEKEEFRVEYLEQLLIDIAKHKTRATNDEEATNDDKDAKGTDRSKTKYRPTSLQNMGLEESSETSCSNVDDNIQSALESAEAIDRDSANQCISEMPNTQSVSRSNSEVPNRNRGSENKRPRCNTHPDISNYVTVIEVNGLNVVKGERMKEAIDNKGTATKKIPPVPPPKKFYRKSKSGNHGSVNTGNGDDDAGSHAEEIYDEQNECESHETQDEDAAACLKTRSVESVDAEVKLEDHFVQEKSPLEDASSEDGMLPDDEEPYYDSVALDGEYVYLDPGKYLSVELFLIYCVISSLDRSYTLI